MVKQLPIVAISIMTTIQDVEGRGYSYHSLSPNSFSRSLHHVTTVILFGRWDTKCQPEIHMSRH